jgi:hypothetical protein
MSRIASAVLAAVVVVAGALPASADSSTTRIEPRPFYGATVTLEEGVRVFRPLPPTRHVIINPQGRTPLNLSFEDVRVTEQRTINNYNHGGDTRAAPSTAGGGYYVPRQRGGHGHAPAHTATQPVGMPTGAR